MAYYLRKVFHDEMATTKKRRDEMRSLAIFPCTYTYGASIIGELANRLRLKVYTGEMLFADVTEQFGIPTEEVRKIIVRRMPSLTRHLLQKKKAVDLLRYALAAQQKSSARGRLFYGLHTSLLEDNRDTILKVLIFDEPERRIQRARVQEGLTEKAARDHIRKHDEKASGWNKFLYQREAYDRSLYDLVIPIGDRNPLDISENIVDRFKRFGIVQEQSPAEAAFPVLDNYPYQDVPFVPRQAFQPVDTG